MKNQRMISIAVIAAIVLIILSAFRFNAQIDLYIDKDMHSQIEAIQKNSTKLIQNELNYLKRITASAAQLISQTAGGADEDILQTLEDYASASDIVRALFVTLDGHAYTSYAGYLGQSDENLSLDGIPIAEIKDPILSNPTYSEDLDEVIFGVVTPTVMKEKEGVLVSSYNVSQLYTLLENEFIGGFVEIGITNNKGNVIIGDDIRDFQFNIFDGLSNVDFSNSSMEEMRSNFADGRSGFSSYYVNGLEGYCSYAPITLNDWYVIVLVKEAALRSGTAELEKFGLELAVELVVIMIGLLSIIITATYKEQKKVHNILQKAAMIDGLTGIYNRSTAESEITRILHMDGEDTDYAMLIIDIDNFKSINDNLGHIFGDHVITACATRLKEFFHTDDIIGRLGGDEFVVLTKNCSDMQCFRAEIESFITGFFVNSGTEGAIKISTSIGISLSKATSHSFATMYRQADDALYRAKRQGKGRFSF